jgi:hypothetical protein
MPKLNTGWLGAASTVKRPVTTVWLHLRAPFQKIEVALGKLVSDPQAMSDQSDPKDA